MKRELSALMRPTGYEIEWRDLNGDRGGDVANLVVVELEGLCQALPVDPHERIPLAGWTSLGSSVVEGKRVLPFARVHCRSLDRLMAPALVPEVRQRRDFLYGRAMARILAHELYHILAQTSDHSHDGIAKAAVRAQDLLAETFGFESDALAKLRKPHRGSPLPAPAPTPVSSDSAEAELAGR
jgi:hypothetical protein